MTILKRLPNEMLIHIIKETSAGDIASLASCCKHLHTLAQDRLGFHKRKRAEAEDVVVGWGSVDSPAFHPSKYLRDILENDDVRFYTKVMRIGFLGLGDPKDDEVDGAENSRVTTKENLIASIESQFGRHLSVLVAKVHIALLQYVTETDFGLWTDEIMRGDPSAIVILLLAVYPNLKALYIDEPEQEWWKEESSMNEKVLLEEENTVDIPWREKNACGAVFRSLTNTTMVPSTNKMKIFSKLSEFYLRGIEDSEGCVTATPEMFTPFQALPTMRKIVGRIVYGRSVHWPYDTGTSEVTELALGEDIDTASLSNLIRGCRALKQFEYTLLPPVDVAWENGGGPFVDRLKWGPYASDDFAKHESDEDDSENDDNDEDDKCEDSSGKDDVDTIRWEPRAITASLLQYTRNSLVSLDLKAGSFSGVAELSRNEPFIESLRSFRALKKVRLETMMLFERITRSQITPIMPTSSVQQPSRDEIRAKKLVDFLPATIEELKLVCCCVGKGFSQEDVQAMFTGLPGLRYKVPKFSTIFYEWEREIQNTIDERFGSKELERRCEESDIELVVML